ncbi:MAG: glycosyltransferase family 39 protein [Acidobacteria bacterium]|nr:glycosyltransferase family 39 protein [Acidobacteriota bacterium]
MKRDQRLNFLLAILLIACITRLWLMPLGSSFWVDEIVTGFVVRQGPSHPSLAVAPQVPKSLYYLLLRVPDALFGYSEIAYRLPSVLVMGVALLLIARLASRLVHRNAAWFAVFASLALSGINYQAADARPYGLGICVTAASMFFLVRWLDSPGWANVALFLLSASLLWRVHLTFWPMYIALVLYAVVRLTRRDTPVGWLYAGAAFAALGFALLPVLLESLSLLREASAHVIVAIPSFRAFFNSLKLGLVLTCAFGAWLLHAETTARAPISEKGIGTRNYWLRPGAAMNPSWTSFVLIAGWWLCQPLFLFAFSHLSGNSVFVSRYLSVALPGAALAATFLAGLYLPLGRWKPLALLLGLGVLLNQGQWGDFWPQHDVSDWRAAAQKINELRLDPETPVILPSPFIEAKPPDWQPDYPLPGFLYAHLSVYPIPGKPYFFPFGNSPEAEQRAIALTKNTLASSKRFIIYGSEWSVDFWRRWLPERPELGGWHQTQLGPFGNVDVVLFEKGSTADPVP